MPESTLKEIIRRWRSLPEEERQRIHLEAIPSRVANSMAMEGEPVDEEWIRQRLEDRMRQRGISKPESGS